MHCIFVDKWVQIARLLAPYKIVKSSLKSKAENFDFPIKLKYFFQNKIKINKQNKNKKMTTQRVREQVLSTRPFERRETIRTMCAELKDKVNIRPDYQRDIKWLQPQMCELIDTVMSGGYMPDVVLYQLQPSEVTSDVLECIDGQHRLFVLSTFIEGKMVALQGKKPFMITWDYKREGEITHVFYKENEQTKDYLANHPDWIKADNYMTEDERWAFDSFVIGIKQITTPLTINQRKKLFTTMQQGTPVRNSDFHKNADEPLTTFIFEQRLEQRFKQPLLDHMTKQPAQYWLSWFIRFYYLSIGDNKIVDEDGEHKFARDTHFTELIKRSRIEEPQPEQLATFLQNVERLFGFLESTKCKFPPVAILALYQHLIDAPVGYESILSTHLSSWKWSTVKKNDALNVWEVAKDKPDDRVEHYFECLAELGEFTEPCEPVVKIGKRKPIAKCVKVNVWKRDFGEEFDGKCYLCPSMMARDKFDAGHIVAWVKGGADHINNLRPICHDCNMSMGDNNMDEFKVRHGL